MRTTLTLTFFFSFLFSYAQNGEWEMFYPATTPSSVAAKGNTILVGVNGTGLVLFDTLGNRQFFNTCNSGLPSNEVRQVALDATGNWWVGYNYGIAYFNGTDWQSWSMADVGLPDTTINAIRISPAGSVYITAIASGAAIYQNGTWSTLNSSNSGLPSNRVNDIAFDLTGKVYFATLDGGLVIQDGPDWVVYNAASTGLSNFNMVKSIAITASGTIWVTNGLQGFAKFEMGNWTQFSATDIGITSSPVLSVRVLADKFDRLWISFTTNYALLQGGNWTIFTPSDLGCSSSSLSGGRPAVDDAGQFWATACGGLSRYDGVTWSRHTTENSSLPGSDDNVNSISQDVAGNIWFATQDGIARFDGTTWDKFLPTDYGASDDYVSFVQADRAGQVWFDIAFGTTDLRFDGTNWEIENNLVGDVLEIAAAPNGDLWMSNNVALRKHSNGIWSTFNYSSLPINAEVLAIAVGQNQSVWCGTGQGLMRYNGSSWEAFTIANSGLPGNDIRDLAFAPDGALWACTDNGLARFDGIGWATMNTANSNIPSDDVGRIVIDGSGNLYILHRNPAIQIAVYRNGEWSDLLPPGYESTPPMFYPFPFMVDHANRLWFGSNAFVFMYDPMLVSTENHVENSFPISAFPNPASGTVVLQLPAGLSGDLRVQVRNTQGQLVQTSEWKPATGKSLSVDIGRFPAGIYWLTVYQGGRAATAKVVKL